MNKAGISRLDSNYTGYGRVIKGMNVAGQIAAVKRDEKDEPLQAVMLKIDIIKMSQQQLAVWEFESEMKLKK